MKQYEQVIVHHNPLFDDDNDDYNQHSVQMQFSDPTSEKNEDEDEGIHKPTVHAFFLSSMKKKFQSFNNMQKINLK